MAISNSNPLVRWNVLLIGALSNLQSFALLVFRLSLGWKTYLSGYRHLHNIPGTVELFVGWGVPHPTFNVYVSGITEVVGGLLLMFGLATRLISIPLIFNFCVAIATAGRDSVTQLLKGGQVLPVKLYSAGRLSGLEAVVDDTAFPFLMLVLVMLAFGPGKASIDHALKRTVFKRHAKA